MVCASKTSVALQFLRQAFCVEGSQYVAEVIVLCTLKLLYYGRMFSLERQIFVKYNYERKAIKKGSGENGKRRKTWPVGQNPYLD